MFPSPLALLTLIVAAASTAVIAAPARADEPRCPVVPAEFWECYNDCLYKICLGKDAGCMLPCDRACKDKWTPGCDPGPF
ncbi:hypothetical protein B0H63DRAFT_557001 [Podospora didyma]|uniref:Uncharacterized protein n=1 Tax=Podospora didyma TaxID=330526 RepID=A0AAE0U462_9PEZI|nr:hypothetical protein B0H63DRAFT_557001 [Podospora didyma]